MGQRPMYLVGIYVFGRYLLGSLGIHRALPHASDVALSGLGYIILFFLRNPLQFIQFPQRINRSHRI
jgi:hypothetical protein